MNWSPLLRWYAREGRDLPWRKTHDAYRILVSEVMLQQTQASRVLIFYKTWLQKFPTWHSLARASNSEVIHAWAGLGYNRRGLMLRDIAKQIVAGGVPKTEEEWISLKGIGPYTAAAVSAFAQHKKTIPVDTNIRRVLGRVVLGKPFPHLKDDRRLKKKIGPRSPELWQATFDLAVSICKKNPDCDSCPMRNQCPVSKKFLSGKIRIPRRMTRIVNEKKHRDKPFPDRIYRGKILAELRVEKDGISLKKLGPKIDPNFIATQDQAWIEAMAARLVKDGLAKKAKKRLLLP
jgi:A/G-specific adenine glycosylase